jgi:transmembrane sensor
VGNVVSLSEELKGGVRSTRQLRPESRTVRWRVALVASVMLAALTAILFYAYMGRDTFATDIGEQRVLTLNDGSLVQLNAQSRVRVRYTSDERRVDLLKGQALFTVAKNARRPFIVDSGGMLVRAVGTQFDVYRRSNSTTVTVVEGSVSAGGAREGQGATMLTAGEQLTVRGNASALASEKKINVATATAWTQRQLIFDNTPLSEVATEFNRYNRRQLRVRDSQIDGFAIDGVFSSTDPVALIRFLRSRPDMVVTETENEIIVTSR